jgi:hypothetical protein
MHAYPLKGSADFAPACGPLSHQCEWTVRLCLQSGALCLMHRFAEGTDTAAQYAVVTLTVSE